MCASVLASDDVAATARLRRAEVQGLHGGDPDTDDIRNGLRPRMNY